MEDPRLTQHSQSSRGGRAASLVIVALLLILLIVTSSADAAAPKPLALKPASLTPATATLPYRAQLSVTNGVAPYAYSLQSGSLPAGVSLSEAGALEGTPTHAGTYEFTIAAGDSSEPARSGAATYTLTVHLDVGAQIPAPAQPGHVLTVEPDAVGGDGAYTYSIVAGELPPGIEEFGYAGFEQLVGYPQRAGIYTFTLQAQDAAGDSGTDTVTVKVPLGFSPGEWEAREAAVGQPYDQAVLVVGGSGDYSYTVTKGSLPPGTELRRNSLGEEIAGTPTKWGLYPVTITGTDLQDGATVSGRLKIPVFSSPVPLQLSELEEPGATEPMLISLYPSAERHGVISGTVAALGNGQFTYDTSNGHLHFTQVQYTESGETTSRYDVLCQAASHICTGTGPNGAVTLH